MMIRKFKFILPILFVLSLFTSFESVANEDPKDKVLLTILRYVLTKVIISQQILTMLSLMMFTITL